ncbi:MAG: hypothetical protein AB1696_27215 [Planctomycetota bacterium]
MTNDRENPWPSSWPPFWRAVLHVLIATAVGNLIWSAGVFAGFRLRPMPGGMLGWLAIIGVCGIVAAGVIGSIMAGLRGVEERSRFALVVALCIGALAFSGSTLMPLLCMPTNMLVFAAGLGLSPVAASGIITLIFSHWVRGLCSHSLKGIFLLGTVSLYAGFAWVLGTIAVAFELNFLNINPRMGQGSYTWFRTDPILSWIFNLFTISISTFVLVSLTFSVMALLLLQIAADHQETDPEPTEPPAAPNDDDKLWRCLGLSPPPKREGGNEEEVE